MDIAVWIASGILALILGGAGASKLVRSREKILENPNMGWADDFSQTGIRLIGLAEVAGALGSSCRGPRMSCRCSPPSPGTAWPR